MILFCNHARSALSILLLCACVLQTGCQYERIEIRAGRSDLYEAIVLSHYKDVEVVDGGLRLKPGARLAIRTELFTQTLAQLEVAIVEGSGMVAYTRTVADSFDPASGVAIAYSTAACTVRLPDGTTLDLGHRADNEQEYIQIYNEADLLAIDIGCSRLYEGHVELPATEYLIVETLPGSTVELRSVMFFETNIR